MINLLFYIVVRFARYEQVLSKTVNEVAANANLMHSYSIHGIADIRSDVPLHLPSFFEVESLDGQPDITVRVGEVAYEASDEHRVGAKYFWNPDQRRLVVDWAKDALMWSNVRAAVSNLQSSTKVEVTEMFHRFGDFNDLVLSVVRFRLLQENAVVIHTAGLKPDDGPGFLIQGLSNMGKSSTSLPLAVEEGYGFLGDDSVMIQDDSVYCYPRQIGISPGTVIPEEILTSEQQTERRFRNLMSLIPLNRAIPAIPDSNMDISPDKIANVTPQAKVDRCYFLESSQGENDVFELDTDEALRRTSVNVMFEGDGAPVKIHHLMKTYCYLDDQLEDGLVAEKYLNIIHKFFRNIDHYEIRAPKENIRPLIKRHISSRV